MTDAVLVIRRGGLGDTLLMLPLLAALRREHPFAKLWFAGVLDFASVLFSHGAVDCAISSESLQLWSLGLDSVTGAQARARLSSFARILSDDLTVATALPSCRVQTYDPRPLRDDAPLAAQLALQLGLSISLADASLPSLPDVHERLPIVLAPGSGGAIKCWPPERFVAQLASSLRHRGESLAVVVGPAEVERKDPRSFPWPPGTAFLVGLSCEQLALQLVKARAFVGNDSGVTHLAAALRVPTVAIFGPTEPRVWAPPQKHVRVVATRTQGPPDVSVEVVLAALDSLRELLR
jgi:ADP-heptose:LPS heptosyltransferase